MVAAWGVHRISDVVGSKQNSALTDRGYVRAIPLPYTGNRLYAAYQVLMGNAYALQWPKDGDLEKALER